jgi:hypothetical protein
MQRGIGRPNRRRTLWGKSRWVVVGFPMRLTRWRIALVMPHALRCPAMWTLLDDLNAFLQEHRRCGEMLQRGACG